MSSIVARIRQAHIDGEVADRSGQFVQLAKCLLHAGPRGAPVNALKIAESTRASQNVCAILKSAVAIGPVERSWMGGSGSPTTR